MPRFAHGESFFKRAMTNAGQECRSLYAVLFCPLSERLLASVRFIKRMLSSAWSISRWSSEHFLMAHFAIASTRTKRDVANYTTRIFTPASQRLSDSERGQVNIASSIASLLLRVREFAIAWAVVARVVLAVDRKIFKVSVGQCPLNERGSIVPLLADGNSACSVVRVTGIDRVITAPHHGIPNPGESRMFTVRHEYFMLNLWANKNNA